MARRSWLARGARTGAVLGLIAVAAAACTVAPPVASLPPGFDAAALTREGPGQYRLTATGDSITVTGADESGFNTRLAVWRPAGETTDQLSCATFARESSGWNQEGVALRIRSDGDGTRAITITKSIYALTNFVFNVHVMDTRAPDPFTLIGGADLRATFAAGGRLLPLPWRMCGRVIDDRVDFIVWPLTEAQPAWGDPGAGRAVTLPAGWEAPGQVGWYAGHLFAHQQLALTDLVAEPAGVAATRA